MLQTNSRTMAFRFNRTPPRNLPLTVRSVGHYQLPLPGVINPPTIKWFCQLFWITEGLGEMRLGRKAFRLKAGDFFYYLPGECHDMRHLGVSWSYRWITFDHAEAPRWLDAFGLHRPLSAGPCPHGLFVRIDRLVRQGTLDGDRAAAHQAHALFLTTLGRETSTPEADSAVERCRRRMDNNFADPMLTVDRVARDEGLHRSTLFRLFRKTHEITPSRYLHNLRIRRALALLPDRRLQIQEIAWQSGFADPNYFSRAIREATGLRPHDFRN